MIQEDFIYFNNFIAERKIIRYKTKKKGERFTYKLLKSRM
jgi:hypothetical protein